MLFFRRNWSPLFFFLISLALALALLSTPMYNIVPRVLSYPTPGARERDPGKRWSRVSQEKKKTQEGSLFLKVLSPQIFVNINTRQTFLVRDQPRSQGSLRPAPWSERGPGRTEPWERGWLM